MFKKFIGLFLVGLLIMSLSGCTASRREARKLKRARTAEFYKKIHGWEYVRIEKKVPHKDCEYIIQEACGEKDASRCYNWYKQQAKFYGGNTVVVTEDVRSQKASGASSFGANPSYASGFGSFQAYETISALADYYSCPTYKVGEQKENNLVNKLSRENVSTKE